MADLQAVPRSQLRTPPHAGRALARTVERDSRLARKVSQLVELYDAGGEASVELTVTAADGRSEQLKFADAAPLYGLLEAMLTLPEEEGFADGDLHHRTLERAEAS